MISFIISYAGSPVQWQVWNTHGHRISSRAVSAMVSRSRPVYGVRFIM